MEKVFRMTVCVKSAPWYEAAASKFHGGVRRYEEWDDKSIPRYRREVAFEFNFPVLSCKIQQDAASEIPFYNRKGQKVMLPFMGLRIITFESHDQQFHVYISENLLDQQVDQKNKAGKFYVYAYINEYARVAEVAENIWFSEEHAKTLEEQLNEGYSVDTSLIKPALSGGIY